MREYQESVASDREKKIRRNLCRGFFFNSRSIHFQQFHEVKLTQESGLNENQKKSYLKV